MGGTCNLLTEIRKEYNFFFENMKGRDQLKELRLYRRMILEWISGTWDIKM